MPTALSLESLDTDAVLALLQRAAEQLITPRFRALADDQIAEKKPGDYVTIADRESELALTEALRAAAPDALIVGEEAASADPALLERLAEAPYAFVVDPLDGTGNFVRGSAEHAVLLAELRDAEPVRGWIWQPEYRLAVVAERGRGVFVNGARVSQPTASDPPRLGATPAAAGFGPDGFEIVRTRWCCGVDYPQLVTGEMAAFAYRNPKPWDHAPGALIARELGGFSRLVGGGEYLPGHPVDPEATLVVSADAQFAGRLGVG